LTQDSVVKESLTTAGDGKNYRTKYYNLDVIISVGYRVKSPVGTRFRQWANAVLKDYLLRGGNFVDERVLIMLDKRNKGVSAEVYTRYYEQTKLDFDKHNRLPR